MARNSKIFLTLGASLSDLAVGLCAENTYEDLIKLIRQIDTEQQDWEFTRMLTRLVTELMSEEPGTRVDSGV